MPTERDKSKPNPKSEFSRLVRGQETRKLLAQKRTVQGIWFGLGMMGLVGWSVVVPTLLGAALGIWLDEHHPGKHPWTLALLVAGLTIGCANAWYWVAQQEKAMRDEPEDRDE